MKFVDTPLHGVRLIDIERRGDERGFFARVFCEQEFKGANLCSKFVQANSSLSQMRGTLRGLHYQLAPNAEVKVIKCIRGALWDLVLDLRPDSSSYKRWFGAELNAENRRMMYVPKGVAHAFLTLEDNTEAFYLVSDFYSPSDERGVKWDDPYFGIDWPVAPTEISQKDQSWPEFDSQFHGVEKLRKLL